MGLPPLDATLGHAQQLRATAFPILQSRVFSRRANSRAIVTAALPIDPVTLVQVASAAAASSLLTAAWLRGSQSGGGSPTHQAEEKQQQAPGRQPGSGEAEADSVQQVWDAAWAAFGKQRLAEQPGKPATQAAYQDEAIAAKPLLLLQGIKGTARVHLLALSLAAVEEQISRLPPGAVLAICGSQQWRDVCVALLAHSSLAAAASWLGYVPEELQEAARLQFGSLDPGTLAAAGITCPPGCARPAEAATVAAAASPPAETVSAFLGGWLQKKRRRQRGAAISSGSGSDSAEAAAAGPGGSAGSSGSSPLRGGAGGVSRQTRLESFYWVGLEERMGLYCSVLRLLRSQSIVQHGEQQVQQQEQQRRAWRDGGQPAAFSSAEGVRALPPSSPPSPAGAAAAAAGGLGGGGAVEVRQAARAGLRGVAESAGLRGWRATSAGVKSPSQLLALAPSVLHDMAVMVAEAAAAGYLSDVEGGLDPAAAVRSAIALQGSSGSSGNGVHSGQPASSSLGVGSSGEAAAAALFSSALSVVGQGGKAAAGTTAAALEAPEPPLAPVAGVAAAVANGGEGVMAAGREGLAAAPRSNSGGGRSSLLPLEASYWPTFMHRQLSSTRQLQRFANQVVLQRWLYRYYHAVAAMYEDRMDLFGLGPGLTLQVRRVPLRRVAELNALKGLRYLMSLLLELADLAAPALRALWRNASVFVSWLLVRLIGQSLGLIYKGIKLSLDPTGQRQQRGKGRRSSAAQPPQQHYGPEAALREDDAAPPGPPLWGGMT